jgi:hypothetical protein
VLCEAGSAVSFSAANILGQAVIRHLALRYGLFCNGKMPWNYTRFMQYAIQQVFMHKVGDGYIYIHKLLMEHFAEMEAR